MRRVTSDTSASVFVERSFARFFLVIGVAAAGAAAPATSARADDVDACATASEKGQDLRDQARLRAARDLFVTCAAARCPAVVRKDCAGWLAAVDEALPSVAIRARDAAGHDLADVRVTVDDEVFVERLDGRALVIDPGAHTFRFTAAGMPEVTQKLLLHEREKGRLVDVVLGAPAVDKERALSLPAASLVLGGISLASFGAMAGFGWSAKSAVDDLRATCEGHCDPDVVGAAKRDMIIANVALGAGVAALGAALVITIVANRSTPAKAAFRLDPGPHGAPLRIRAGAGGVILSGSF